MRRAVRAIALILVLSLLVFFLLCFRVTRGEALDAEALYCEEHSLLTVTLVLPRSVPTPSEAFDRLAEMLPPIVVLPPRILWELTSDLWRQARRAVKEELGGCVAFP
jgi:hypothetical protein